MQYIQDGVQGRSAAEGVLANLRVSLQLLASNARDQIAHFLPSDFLYKADEMALDYDHWATSAPNFVTLSDEQSYLLKSLSEYLTTKSTGSSTTFWTDEALLNDPDWERVRHMAKVALAAFGWRDEVPPPQRLVDMP